MAESYGFFFFLNHLDNLRLLIGIFRLNWNVAVARVRLQSTVSAVRVFLSCPDPIIMTRPWLWDFRTSDTVQCQGIWRIASLNLPVSK